MALYVSCCFLMGLSKSGYPIFKGMVLQGFMAIFNFTPHNIYYRTLGAGNGGRRKQWFGLMD